MGMYRIIQSEDLDFLSCPIIDFPYKQTIYLSLLHLHNSTFDSSDAFRNVCELDY
uniref:Uncharacterized protein n=1 Tax=Anguilla anguilla TaxID=7936 RepID=A0A0E9QYI2_ANGAN